MIFFFNVKDKIDNVKEEIKQEDKNKEKEKEDNKKEEEKDKNIDSIKSLSLLNETIGDGINNFDTIIESTKNAGEEINYSFRQLSENLEKFTQQLKEHTNNNNNNNADC